MRVCVRLMGTSCLSLCMLAGCNLYDAFMLRVGRGGLATENEITVKFIYFSLLK